ncbi:T7SS effector LXG polymorphic toxin [Pontibacillus halophilus]|uniref:T7SS effector LXG polymorphic toxin n=1 Tax=Pontibacillus halophilus TaxID=516704 RepID=UPI0012B61363|nr:T7SS effector LXG polymorphic toxin [Pontibacillus halophilus]
MKVYDAESLESGVQAIHQRLRLQRNEVEQLEKSIKEMVSLTDSFAGEGGDAIRYFYEEYHLTFLAEYKEFMDQYQEKLRQLQRAMHDMEPSTNGYIREDYLNQDVEQGLDKTKQVTSALTSEANQLLQRVSDIVSTPQIDDSRFIEQVGQARNDKEDTITKLQSFDQSQTKDISALDSSVDALKSRVETLQNVVQEATIQVNNQNQTVGEKQSEDNVKSASGGFWGVIKGIFEGIKDFLVDMLTGLFGVLKTLFKYYMNPELLAMDIYQAVSNPGETWESVKDVAKYAVEGVKQAWIDDVVNGDAQSRARFFTYGSLTAATTFVGFGAGNVSKVGALGKATQAVSKAKSTNIPYNAMKTTALQKAMADGMRKTMEIGKQNMLQVLTSRPFKDMLSIKAISDRASVALTRTRNLLRPENMKTSINKVYNEVIKGPITRTNAWAKQQVAAMSQSLQPRWEVVGDGIRTDFGRGDVSADLNYAYVKGDGDYNGRQVDGVDYGRGSVKGTGNRLAGESDVKTLVGRGEQYTNGRKNRLKPNIRYQTGEYDYFYETDGAGRLVKFETENLQLTARTDRLSHSKNTPGKVKGQDHAGHLAGDRFGGSPKIDNLVSQLSDVNLKEYKKIEDTWAAALKETPPKEVTVDVEIVYDGNNMRPEKFIVNYAIDGKLEFQVIKN